MITFGGCGSSGDLNDLIRIIEARLAINQCCCNPVPGGSIPPSTPTTPSGISVGLALPVSVFNVTNSPVTSVGTLTGSFIPQNANYVFAAPADGPGIPTFRPLEIGDVPQTPLTTIDTEAITLTGQGTIISPLAATAVLSEVGGNMLQILPDGLYAANVIQQGVIYGGIVTWIDDYNYHVSAAGYYINGFFYESPAADFTLDAPDVTFNRLDTFIVNTSGVAGVLQGTPSLNPAQAPLDPATQLELSIALVEVGTTQPTLDVECLYNDNLQWTTSTSNVAKINPDSGVTPCNGSKSIEGTGVVTGDNILLSRGSNFTPASLFTQLKLTIRSKGFSGNPNMIRLQWENGGTPIGVSVPIRHLAFGFQGTDTVSCQTISIPLTFFGITPTTIVNSLRITGSVTVAGGIGFFLDDICLQGQPIAEIPAPPDEKVKVSANDTTPGYLNGKLLAGTGISFVENNNGANETLTISATNVTTADNGLTLTGNNIQLGGLLLHDTTISSNTFGLTLTGSVAGNSLTVVNNAVGIVSAITADAPDASGTAIRGTGGNIGVSGASTAGAGGRFSATSGYGISASATTGEAGVFQITPITDNDIHSVASFQRFALGGTADVGIGLQINLGVQTDGGGSAPNAAQIIAGWNDPVFATRSGFFGINVTNNGVEENKFLINSAGQLNLGDYGINTFADTPDYLLGVNAAGDVIEVDPSAAGSLTADNGLTVNTPGNVRLGGTLLSDTTIAGTTLGRLFITGSPSFVSLFRVTVTGTGSAGEFISDSGPALLASSTSGLGGSFTSTTNDAISAFAAGSGAGIAAQSVSGLAGAFIAGPANDDFYHTVAYFRRNTTGTAQMGMGGRINLDLEDAAGAARTPNQFVWEWTDPASLTATSRFTLNGMLNGVTGVLAEWDGDGSQRWQGYGSGAITAGAAAFGLAVDNVGNVIEIALGGGGGGTVNSVAGTLNRITSTGGTDPIIDISASYAGQASINTLGTITTGTWNATPLTDAYISSAATWNAKQTGDATLTALAGLTITNGSLIYGTGADAFAVLPAGANGQILRMVAGLPAWDTITGTGTVISVSGSGGTTGFSFTGGPITTSGTLTLTGTLAPTAGGTGLTSVAQGAILYGSAANVYSTLPKDTNATRYLSNTGTNNNPAWAQINLSNGVTNRLAFANIVQAPARSVVVNPTGSTANLMTITGTANQLLRIDTGGSTLGFGAINLASSAAVGSSILAELNGGTGESTYAAGEILVGNSSNGLSKATMSGSNGVTVDSTSGAVNVRLTANPARQTLTDGSTITWNANNGSAAVVTLGNTGRTLTITNPIVGTTYIIEIIQGTGGGKTITTWPTGTTWVGGPPTLSSLAGQVDVVTLYWNGTNYRANFDGPYA